MKRMLINATQPEELRVAIAEGQHLFDLDIEVPSQEQKKSNVYKGRITRVEPSLEACFVEFGSTRHGFLPLKEICPSSYSKTKRKKDGRLNIREAVQEGQEIIVQVEKEERGNKGAALTTYISLAGRYLVLMPTNPSAGGVSRRITGSDRDHLREQLQQVTTPDNVGIIIRTAGVGRDADELQWDLDYLLQLWTAIEQAAANRSAPFLIYQESNLFIRALRDHLRADIGEILIDNEGVYNDAREFMQQVMPHNLNKLKLYNDQVPLFNRYQIESQIESAFARTVHLPSGGAVVIDHTEALLSLDINSARATKGSDIEETAYNTNMEAANEIARQLRLRDLGGLIVIDFIDMTGRKHQREVEECLRRAMQIDKARVQIGRISRFGLLEMSRQRLRPSLGESSQETCPRCDGHGNIRSVESLALSILRLVEEEVMKDYTGQIVVQAPTEVVNFLHNEKRAALAEVESRHRVPIVLLANQHLVTPHFEILRVRKTEISDDASYTRVEQPDTQLVANERSQANAIAVPAPAVKRIVPERPAPQRNEDKEPGLFARLANILFSGTKEESEPPARKAPVKKAGSSGGRQQSQRRSPQSARQHTQRKTKQKTGTRKAAPKTGAGGAASKKRGARKAQPQSAQAKAAQSKAAQGKSAQARPPRNRRRPPKPKSAATDKSRTSAADTTSATANKPVEPSTVTDGRETEQKEAASRGKTSRRRRSPYKTGGTKPRSERNDAQTDGPVATGKEQTARDSAKPGPASDRPAPASDKQTSASNKQTPASDQHAPTETAKKPVKAATVPGAAESGGPAPVKPAQTKTAPVATAAGSTPPAQSSTDKKSDADKAAKSGDDKAAADKTTPVSKAAESGDKPVKIAKKTARKKSATKKTSKKTAAPASSKTSKPTSLAEPEKGTKGLYTLKPQAAEKPAPAAEES